MPHFSSLNLSGLPPKKALAAPGPLERLFGGPVAAVMDFFMLAAHKDQYYLESEIAGYAGLQPKKTRSALCNLHGLGLLQQSAKGRKKMYALADSDVMGPLEKLMLALTDKDVKGGIPTSDSQLAGDAVAELVEKGILHIDRETL